MYIPTYELGSPQGFQEPSECRWMHKIERLVEFQVNVLQGFRSLLSLKKINLLRNSYQFFRTLHVILDSLLVSLTLCQSQIMNFSAL